MNYKGHQPRGSQEMLPGFQKKCMILTHGGTPGMWPTNKYKLVLAASRQVKLRLCDAGFPKMEDPHPGGTPVDLTP